MHNRLKDRNDQELLQAWRSDRCERSFRHLVERYTDLVFGTALRRTRNRVLAEEAAQNVFTTLARKADELNGAGGLGGWLFRAAVLEAASLLRRETRRERRMRELTELEDALHRVGGEPMTGEALELVDDSLAGLADAERDLLVARFFEGHSFAELAKRSGSNEGALRKQVSRALQKLNDALAGHGIRVSTTVLVAGLSVMMATKAPSGLSSSLAAGAMAGVGKAAGSGTLTTIATAMTTSKLTTTLVVGGLLVLVTSGVGYFAGRSNAERSQGSDRIGSAEVEKNGGNEERVARSAGAASTPVRSEKRELTRVEEVVRRLRGELKGRNWLEALKAGRQLVKSLNEEEIEEALVLIRGSAESEVGRAMWAVCYGHWGTLNGRAAVAAASAEESEFPRRLGVEQVVQQWAALNPQDALEWHREAADDPELSIDETTMGRVLGTILQGWAMEDMNAAWDHFESLDTDGQGASLGQLEDLIKQEQYREAMAARIAQIKDERVRSRVAEDVGETWARIDPKATTEWFDTMEFEDEMLRLRAAMEIGEGWFEKDPLTAVKWLWPKVPEGMRSHFAEELGESEFGEDDEKMTAFMAEQGYNRDGTPKE